MKKSKAVAQLGCYYFALMQPHYRWTGITRRREVRRMGVCGHIILIMWPDKRKVEKGGGYEGKDRHLLHDDGRYR